MKESGEHIMNMRKPDSYTPMDIINTFQAAMAPLTAKIQVLEDKVDRLSQDRITRGDLEKLSVAFVPRDAYEARHAALIEKDKNLEDDVRDLRNMVDQRFKEVQETSLSDKDRSWVRVSQVLGGASLLVSLLSILLSHITLH